MLLCFTFLLGHVGNCVLGIGKGALMAVQAWKDFLCRFRFLFGFEGWGVELEEVLGGFSLTLTSIP